MHFLRVISELLMFPSQIIQIYLPTFFGNDKFFDHERSESTKKQTVEIKIGNLLLLSDHQSLVFEYTFHFQPDLPVKAG